MADLKAQIEITADASGVEAGVSQGKRALKELGEAGKRAGEEANKGIGGIGDNGNESAQKVDRATKNIISSIQRTTAAMEAGSRGTSDYYKVIASQRGANTDALKPYLDQLDQAIIKQQQAAKSLGNVGISAGQTAAALRGVPAQFTDIVTSLQGGQAPMTVLIQQGGQLKDMFGGVGNAAKAMGGYVLGLINPITIAAGAAATIGLAFKSGSEEANGLAKALILTGNAANTSVDQLKNVATAVTASSGATKSAVMDALTQIAETGQVSAKVMGVVASAALAMEKAGGQAISETVKQAAELGKEPVKASIKLNEQYNYLTAKVYEQIKAFEDQGRATEAAALAQETYAKAMEERARSITGELGTLEKAWKGITGTAKSAWDAMLGIGREGSIEERLAQARKDLANGGGLFGGETEARAKVAVLEAQLESQKKLVSEQVKSNTLERAKLAWAEEGDKYLTKELQKKKEIARIEEMGKVAGADPKSIRDRIKAVEEKYKEAPAKDPMRSRDHNEYLAQLKKDADTELDGLVKLRKERQAAAEAAQYLADIQSKFNRANASKSDSLLILPENVARLNTELRNVDQTAEDAKNRLAKMFGDGKLNAEDYAAKLAELNSLTATQKEAVVGLNERQNSLNSSWEYGAEKAMQKYADSANNVAAQTESVFNSTFGSMEEALVRFAQTGKLNFTSLANSIIADILRVKAKAAVSGLADIVSGFFKAPATGTSTGNTTAGYSSGDLGSGIRYPGQHSGGIVGSEPTFLRLVSPSAFSGATKYHTGGIAGDEVPTILRKGEGVFTQGQMKALGGVGSNKMIVNIQPPAGHQAKTQERTDGQGNKFVDVLFEQFESRIAGNIAAGNGAVPAALSGTFGLSRKAGAY